MSLRMMLDAALFFSRHAERIDGARFWKTMERLKYETLRKSGKRRITRLQAQRA